MNPVSSLPQPSPAAGAARRNRIPIALACVVVAAVLAVSFLPSADKRALHTTGRLHSWGHFIAFSIVGYVAGRASSLLRTRVLVFFGSLIFGLGIEAAEHLLYHSPMEWKDVLADALGVVAGTLFAVATARKEQP